MTLQSTEETESHTSAAPPTREALAQQPRPWKHNETLVGSGVAIRNVDELDAACGQRLSELLLVLATWPPGDVGSRWVISDSTFLIVSFRAPTCPAYAQFLSDPTERTVLCEVSSPDYDDALTSVVTPERDKLLLGKLGFEKRKAPSNYRREATICDEASARALARSTAEVLVTALGYEGSSELTAYLVADRVAHRGFVHERLQADELQWLLERWGRRTEILPRDDERGFAPVQWNLGGVPIRATLSGRIKRYAAYRQLTFRAHLRTLGELDTTIAHRWNASQSVVRAVPDGRGNLALVLDLPLEGGVTEQHMRWLVGLFEMQVDRLRDALQAGVPFDE